MEEENKISFWKKIKISIFELENYQNLALQKPVKTVGYLAKLMLVFVFVLSTILTLKFVGTVNNVKQYIENELSEVNFENNVLKITSKDNLQVPIIIEDEEVLNGKIIIDTSVLAEEQINKYIQDVKGYTNGIIILKDKIVLKTAMSAVSSNISFSDVANQYNIVKLDKQEILGMLSGSDVWILYTIFFITMYIYLFVIYFSTILVDALLYSILGYITGIISKIKFKYSAVYNIASYSLTLPIALNLIYMTINLLTGYTIKYFDVMYMAITCIYIITAILMIKSDIIKRQMELSKIISEQEKVKAELARKQQEKEEEEERERIRKEDEKKRKGKKKRKKIIQKVSKKKNLQRKNKENQEITKHHNQRQIY